ncbi:TetR/AcrR family transcriptional regulator [Roseicyclus sp.]
MARGLARDHAEKRAAIRAGAARYFAAEGYARASMAGAARACGVSKALLYHYYDGKEALLFDILEQHLGALAAAVERVAPDGPPEARLRRLIHAILAEYEDADAEHKLQLDALALLPEPMQAPLLTLQRRIVSDTSRTLEALRPGLGPRRGAVTMSVFGMLNWVYMWHRPDKGMSRASYADLATDLVLGGLRGL